MQSKFPDRRAGVALCIFVTLFLCPAWQAVACDMCRLGYCPLHGDGGPGGVVASTSAGWPQANPGDPVNLTWNYENMLDGGLLDPDGNSIPESQIRTAVEEAFEVWSEVVPIHFTEVESGGNIRFRHRWINGPDPPVGNPTTKAQAFFPSSGRTWGYVDYDNGDPWSLIGTTREPDILGAAIHEIGHTIGLRHTNVPEANMYWIFKRHTGPGSGMLHPDDISRIRAIYGPGVGSVTPLSSQIPEPGSRATLLLALLTSGWILRAQSCPRSELDERPVGVAKSGT